MTKRFRLRLYGHRGASVRAPENTLAAVDRAIVDGAHWVEIDVQEAADDTVFYVCGPARLIGAVQAQARDLGIHRDRIRLELFS